MLKKAHSTTKNDKSFIFRMGRVVVNLGKSFILLDNKLYIFWIKKKLQGKTLSFTKRFLYPLHCKFSSHKLTKPSKKYDSNNNSLVSRKIACFTRANQCGPNSQTSCTWKTISNKQICQKLLSESQKKLEIFCS